MTTVQERRCLHCRRTYTYYTSGPALVRRSNDTKWCPECYTVAYDALRARRLIQRILVHEPVTDEALRQVILQEWLPRAKAPTQTLFGPAYPVGSSLFNRLGAKVATSWRVEGAGDHAQHAFIVTEYVDERPPKVEIMIEYQVADDHGQLPARKRLGPWRDLSKES